MRPDLSPQSDNRGLQENRPTFLPVHRYVSQEQLLADIGEKVIRPAELKVSDLRASS
jgi:hypothetical protein